MGPNPHWQQKNVFPCETIPEKKEVRPKAKNFMFVFGKIGSMLELRIDRVRCIGRSSGELGMMSYQLDRY